MNFKIVRKSKSLGVAIAGSWTRLSLQKNQSIAKYFKKKIRNFSETKLFSILYSITYTIYVDTKASSGNKIFFYFLYLTNGVLKNLIIFQKIFEKLVQFFGFYLRLSQYFYIHLRLSDSFLLYTNIYRLAFKLRNSFLEN